MPDKSSPIIIVGGGAFGLSTALHLTQKGYSNITVFEKDSQIPAKYSAANDLNKIVRAEYEDDWYTDLTVVRTLLSPRKHSPEKQEQELTRVLSNRKPSKHGNDTPSSNHTSTKPASSTVCLVNVPRKPSGR